MSVIDFAGFSRQRFVKEDGTLTREALALWNAVLTRIGGPVSVTINELALIDDDDSGLEEFKHESGKRFDAQAMAPIPYEHPAVQQLLSEVAELQSTVAVLRRQINDLQQGTML